MEVPTAFKQLLGWSERHEPDEHWTGPVYVLWVFDPVKDKVIIEHNKDVPRALTKTHSEIAPEVVHPSRTQGYAYRIARGWRLTSDDHKVVTDPHIIKRVDQALKRQFPPKSLPKVL